jgi:hypothetical protein
MGRLETNSAASSEFRQSIIEAVDLLRNEQLQEAAFKIDDAMLLLPPEKRIDRGGVAEWGREWWQGHLMPIRLAGGRLPGGPPGFIQHGAGSDIYMTLFGLDTDAPELLIDGILEGNILRPHLPDRDNPAWAFDHLMPVPRSLLVAIVVLAQASEYVVNVLDGCHGWLNTVLGLIHASFAHEQSAHRGVQTLLEEYMSLGATSSAGSAVHDKLRWFQDLFATREGGRKGGVISDDLWELLTTPRNRPEWARLNDELAVRHIKEAIRYLPYPSVFHLHLTLAVCLTRLGRYEEAQGMLSGTRMSPTIVPPHPVDVILNLWIPEAPASSLSEALELARQPTRVTPPIIEWDPLPPGNMRAVPVPTELNTKWIPPSTTNRITLGRDSDNDIVLTGRQTSRKHAEIWRLESGEVVIRDLDSTNGTYLNGVRLDQSIVPVPLSTIDSELPQPSIITIGRWNLAIGGVFYNEWHDAVDKEFLDDQELSNYDWEVLDQRIERWRKSEGVVFLREDYLEKEIETRRNKGVPVPFELYHLRSECHQAQGNQEQAEQDRRSAEESLAAEFGEVGP